MNRLGFRSLFILSLMLLILWTLSGFAMLEHVKISQPVANEQERIIRILIRTGTESSALRKIAEPFEASSGIKVEFVELGRDNYFTALGTQLFAGSEAFDILFMPNTSIAQFASANAILPLDSYINNPELTDIESFDINDFLAICRYQDTIYALPTDISTHFLYYRSDLIPNPPKTWDEFYTVAQQFTQLTTSQSPTRWGAAMPAVVPEERSKIFASLLWSFGGDILLSDNGQVKFDSDQSIRAGEYLVKLVKNGVVPQDLLSWDFARTRDELLNGEVAMAAPFWNAAYLDILNSNSPYKDSIKIALIPGTKDASGNINRVPFQHSWTLAINANSTNPTEAWKFLEYATGKKGSRIYAEAGGIPARRSILGDSAYQESRPDYELLLEEYRNCAQRTLHPLLQCHDRNRRTRTRQNHNIVLRTRECFQSGADELRHLYQSIQINPTNRKSSDETK